MFAACLAPCALPAQAQDPGKALGGLLRQLPGGLIPGQAIPSAAATHGTPATNDLVQMLSQSVDNIDEPHEIEIGRQLAAVLLGSKPLLRYPALQRYVNRLGRWISLQSRRPLLPWAFGVMAIARRVQQR